MLSDGLYSRSNDLPSSSPLEILLLTRQPNCRRPWREGRKQALDCLDSVTAGFIS
jgi:hypothetical protein